MTYDPPSNNITLPPSSRKESRVPRRSTSPLVQIHEKSPLLLLTLTIKMNPLYDPTPIFDGSFLDLFSVLCSLSTRGPLLLRPEPPSSLVRPLSHISSYLHSSPYLSLSLSLSLSRPFLLSPPDRVFQALLSPTCRYRYVIPSLPLLLLGSLDRIQTEFSWQICAQRTLV